MIFKVLDDVAREKLAIDLKSKESWLKTLEAAGFSEDSPGASYESMLEFYNSASFLSRFRPNGISSRPSNRRTTFSLRWREGAGG